VSTSTGRLSSVTQVRSAAILVVLLAAAAAAGCGGNTHATQREPTAAAQLEVAKRFARAIVAGDAPLARSLLSDPGDEALVGVVRQAAAPWTRQHGRIRLPAARWGRGRWIFGYAGTRTQSGGRFERLTGDIVVVTGASRRGARVRYFALQHRRVRFSTHHDSVLLPSNR
jgi:hypothetical protein